MGCILLTQCEKDDVCVEGDTALLHIAFYDKDATDEQPLPKVVNKLRVISVDENGIGKASARSIVGFDIGSAIIAAAQEKILIKGGGHKMAAGFSIKVENIEKFKKFIFKKYF